MVIKHTNPCGAAIGTSAADAYVRARDADSLSAFGGIVALNRALDVAAADAIVSTFIEAVIVPSVDDAARRDPGQEDEHARRRRGLRDPALGRRGVPQHSRGDAGAGARLSSPRRGQPWTADSLPDGVKVVTKRQPTADEWEALRFAWRVGAHVKSNTVIFTDAKRTLAIGAGQMSRVDAVNVAVMKARASAAIRRSRSHGSVAASDAFFPFRDGLDAVAAAGATAVVQPGGSVRDAEVIAAADEHGLAMIFTGRRHFRH